MNSITNFRTSLLLITSKLEKYSKMSREEFLEDIIRERLDYTSREYKNLLDNTEDFLMSRDSAIVFREIRRRQKARDKRRIEQFTTKKPEPEETLYDEENF